MTYRCFNAALTGMILLCSHGMYYAQAPNLGSAADFVLFTTTGAIGNTGISQVSGNIGTNGGAISGFGNVNGKLHNTNLVTALCAIDLLSAYNQLNTTAATSFPGPVLGSGQILTPGVYSIPSAASLNLCLILNGQGDSNAVFIFKVQGAFSTGASSKVCLMNGARSCNIFWKVEGAVSMATGTFMRGTIIANNGAISFGATDTLEGRALSTTGAVTIYGTLANIPEGCGRPVLTGPAAPLLLSSTAYGLFSSLGSVSNTGSTYVTGDVGTNLGAAIGFNPLNITGALRLIPDLSTAICSIDLSTTYTYLNLLPYDIELLYPLQLGNKLVLTPHTYLLNGNTVLTDTLYLDARGNPNGVFVFQVNGTFSTGTFSKVKLINGAQSKHVYWKVEGAVNIGSNSVVIGTIICNNGAITVSAGVALYGRALTTSLTGLISIQTSTVTTLNQLSAIVPEPVCVCLIGLGIGLAGFDYACENDQVSLTWSTATESNNAYFTVEYSVDGIEWSILKVIAGSGNSTVLKHYAFVDDASENRSDYGYYRLKQTDADGYYTYSSVISVNGCSGEHKQELFLYPNPSTGVFTIVSDRVDTDGFIVVKNVWGETVLTVKGMPVQIDLSEKPQGIYFMTFQSHSGLVTRKLIIDR